MSDLERFNAPRERFNVAAYNDIHRRAHSGDISLEQAEALSRYHLNRGLNRLERKSIMNSYARRIVDSNYRGAPIPPGTPRWAGAAEASVRRRTRPR
jgi:hypothetical protein